MELHVVTSYTRDEGELSHEDDLLPAHAYVSEPSSLIPARQGYKFIAK